jgi:ATP-dependent DNA helicase RecQ
VDEAAREGLRRAAAGEAPPERLEERPSREEVQQRKRERAREEAIRAWRRGVAAQRGVPPLVILPNPALAWLVRDLPDSVDLLGAHPDIGRKRAQLYGQALLDVLTKSV